MGNGNQKKFDILVVDCWLGFLFCLHYITNTNITAQNTVIFKRIERVIFTMAQYCAWKYLWSWKVNGPILLIPFEIIHAACHTENFSFPNHFCSFLLHHTVDIATNSERNRYCSINYASMSQQSVAPGKMGQWHPLF